MKRLLFLVLCLFSVPLHAQGWLPVLAGSPPSATGPTLTGAALTDSAGVTSLTLTFSESVSIGAGGNGGVTIAPSGGAATATYTSGSGSAALVYALSRQILSSETATTGYTQPGNGIEATTGGADVATYTGVAVTNNSTFAYLLSDNLSYADSTACQAAGWTVVSSPVFGQAGIDGVSTYCVQTNSVADAINKAFSAASDVWVYFVWKTSASASGQGMVQLENSVPALVGKPGNSTSTLLKAYNGTLSGTSGSVTIASDTVYHIWFHYIKGTGANGQTYVYVATTATFPSLDCSKTNGDATTDASIVTVGPTAKSSTDSFNYLRISASQIGSNPP